MKTNREWLGEIIEKAKSGEFQEGVYYTQPNEQGFSIVFGWEDGYEDEEIMQGKYTLCGKVAYNCDDLQSDFDVDWYMPSTKDGDIYDTSMAVRSVDDIQFFEDELAYVSSEYAKGNFLKN